MDKLPVDRATSERYLMGTDEVVVLADCARTGGALFAVEIRMRPGGGPPVMHRHAPGEIYHVLEGEFTFYRALPEDSAEGGESAAGGESTDGARSADGAQSTDGARSADGPQSTDGARSAAGADGVRSTDGAGSAAGVERITARAGDVVPLPGGTPHTIRNESDGDAVAFVVHAPGAPMEGFTRAVAAQAATGNTDMSAVLAIAAENGIELLGPIPAVQPR
jgi:mannose-6-phosphate isomerase-like protein (cupin superfamily)